MAGLNQWLTFANGIIWHQAVIIAVLAIGLFYTYWTKFSQFRSVTHGLLVVLGKYDKDSEPGAITHFQALSTALSATVGVGNIGGTALAIAIGGPGALFWMWAVGLLGMVLKTVEVTIALVYRKVEGQTVSGGAMWVIEQNLEHNPEQRDTYGKQLVYFFGKFVACLFCLTLLIATFTGGLFFQAWNASNVTQQFFGIPSTVVGLVLMTIVGSVILGGIQRIGLVASKIVPFMCGAYLLAGIYVVFIHINSVPEIIFLVFKSAFSTSQSQGAFLGGTMGAVFSIGMRQAFFSNEAGQGSSPIVHAATRTKEPAREGLVAGLEPFIDTIVVCTLTGMVILLTGVWNRDADFQMDSLPTITKEATEWRVEDTLLSSLKTQIGDDSVSILKSGDRLVATLNVIVENTPPSQIENLIPLNGVVVGGQTKSIQWQPFSGEGTPTFHNSGVFRVYDGASLTAFAFESTQPGLGMWLVTLATWLFGISTMISWSYYGEQGIRYLFADRFVTAYRLIFCVAIFLSCSGLVQSRSELTNLVNFGTGVMLWVNIPITLFFSRKAIATIHDYNIRMKQSKTN